MKIELYPPFSIHEIGQRENQEDSIIQWDNRLFLLCDGMGGHEKGEFASQTVCQSLVTWFENSIKPDEPFSDDQLHKAIEFAYTELDKYADGNLRQMGTTLTLLYIGSKGITAAHMGDSRICHIRPNVGLLYQSRDHSLVFDLFQAGEITYEEMATYPQKNMVTHAMMPGEDNRMCPDIIHISDVQPGDYFYMCSDGMMEKMTNSDLLTVFSDDMTDKMKMEQLKMATIQCLDNHSAWIIHIKNVTKERNDDQLENEEPTSRYNAFNILPNPVYDKEDDDVIVVGRMENSFFNKIKGIFK
jgi:protein phosphatase